MLVGIPRALSVRQFEPKKRQLFTWLTNVLDTMKHAAAPMGFVILDACRNNPFAGRPRSVASNELAPVYAPRGTLVAFSTSPGQTAADGAGRNGSYTEALLHHISDWRPLVRRDDHIWHDSLLSNSAFPILLSSSHSQCNRTGYSRSALCQ